LSMDFLKKRLLSIWYEEMLKRTFQAQTVHEKINEINSCIFRMIRSTNL
jgi:hypothetical protein